MASQPPHRVNEGLNGPQHFVPPNARELRAQSVQRLQTGLFGIAAVLLVVGLANIINDRARLNESVSTSPSAQASASASPGSSDPLADIGVVPTTAPSAAASASPGTAQPNAPR